jgi:hypothetical protein
VGLLFLILNLASAALSAATKAKLPLDIIQQLEAVVLAIAKVHGSQVTGAQIKELLDETTWPDAPAPPQP